VALVEPTSKLPRSFCLPCHICGEPYTVDRKGPLPSDEEHYYHQIFDCAYTLKERCAKLEEELRAARLVAG
jgi:hypothetical protein